MTAATARTARRGGTSIEFGLAELDLLTTHAGVPMPFPLRVPSFGRIDGEREVLLAMAGETLKIRGLADEDGPAGAAAELVSALHQYRGTVHLVLLDDNGATGVLAMVYRSSALLCEQPLDNDPASLVRIRRISADALTETLLDLIPEVAPARSMPITLPERAVGSAAQLIEGINDDAEKERRLRDLVRDCGGDPGALDDLSGLLPTLTGRGQIGATRRDGDRITREGTELSWLDSPRGRVRVGRSRADWVSVNPLRPADLRHAVESLAAIARKPR